MLTAVVGVTVFTVAVCAENVAYFYVNSEKGNDEGSGTSASDAVKSLISYP